MVTDDVGQYLLSLDNGTQSVRALLFNQQGELLAQSREVIEPYVSPRPGWAEQNATYYLSLIHI